jgi:hypothetical protein
MTKNGQPYAEYVAAIDRNGQEDLFFGYLRAFFKI